MTVEVRDVDDDDVGILYVKIYDDLALEAWTHKEFKKRERERKKERWD